MKKETYANKLAELLGIAAQHIPEAFKDKPKKGKNLAFVPVDENEIQSFREAQGLIYFLQAPALFEAKICKHCGESFLVSRKFVGYCSYTCIEKSLEEVGVQWNKRIKYAETNEDQFEPMVNDPQVWAGNEPIWITNLDKIREILDAVSMPKVQSSLG